LRFLFRVARVYRFGGGIGKRIVSERARISAGGFCVDAKLGIHFREKLRGIPLIGVLFTRAKSICQLASYIFRDAQNVIALIFALQR
jgi:hypothetical protein